MFFADRVELGRDQIISLTQGSPDDSCWTTGRERVLIRVTDALHDCADLDDELWQAARRSRRA
jgi:hypothetical protein